MRLDNVIMSVNRCLRGLHTERIRSLAITRPAVCYAAEFTSKFEACSESVNQNVVPLPGTDSKSMCPPIFSTIFLMIGRLRLLSLPSKSGLIIFSTGSK